ncbi:PIGZ [Cordylochernes scorpioides]|uniref:Mannosyltransferase n=1 Tax=Cordylochernes scorpioides TaxID=51811 RepID=A0ABY6KD23_9ARAC|nr:PIGZ [Cordylochernes scorpioides]
MPMLFGILAFEVIFLIYKVMHKGYKLDFTNGLFLYTIIFSLIIFSFIPHQEPRFLIPLLIMLCYIGTNSLLENSRKLSLWKLHNVLALIFFGYIHQGGVLPSLHFLQKIAALEYTNSTKLFLVYHTTYMPPRSLLLLNTTNTNVEVHDLAGMTQPILESHLNSYLDSNLTSQVYLVTSRMFPSACCSQLAFNMATYFYPHISTEAFPDIATWWSSEQPLLTKFNHLIQLFSLKIYKVVRNPIQT